MCHINLWSSQPLSAAEVEAEMAARLPPGAQTCWFVNPPVLQSVPAIWHAHIFWQQTDGGSGGGSGKQGRQRPR